MRVNNKNIYRTAIIISFIALNALLLFGLSKVLGYLNSGAERSDMLHLEKETITTYLPKVNWSSLDNPGRKMEQQALKEIEKDYLFSWYVKNNALKANTTEGITDFYTDSARVNLFKLVDYNKANKISIEGTTIEHNPAIDFYSADGQLVVFTDRNIVEYQKIYQDKKLINTVTDTASYKVMMLLEDGFWRIRHIKRMPPEAVVHDSIKPHKLFEVKGDSIMKDGKAYLIKGINYYPKNSAWDMYGDKFSTDTISADFDIIANAKLNTVRIFVPYEDFGKADVQEDRLDKLEQVLDLAEEKNLAVIVTLFDFYSDYTPQNWTLTHRHAEKIVQTFKNHNAILAWDLKNEPDLDFKNRDKDNVTGWLQTLLPLIKKWDTNHLVTIGWSNPHDAVLLQNKVDFVSYHYYLNPNHFLDKYDALKAQTNKPVVLQEFGVSSYRGFWSWFGKGENGQAEYHKKMQAVFKEKQLAFLSWTLYDFPAVPNNVAGKWPWIKNKQKKFGFLDEHGKPKPSFLYITNK